MTVHERHNIGLDWISISAQILSEPGKSPLFKVQMTHLAVTSARKNGEQEEEEEGGGAGGETNHTPSKQVLRQPTRLRPISLSVPFF